MPALSERERYGFDIRGFMMHYGLDGTKAGAHMFREVWSEEVSNIHKDILGKFLLLSFQSIYINSLLLRCGRAEVWQTKENGSVCRTRQAICALGFAGLIILSIFSLFPVALIYIFNRLAVILISLLAYAIQIGYYSIHCTCL